jgi:hypothetical protein
MPALPIGKPPKFVPQVLSKQAPACKEAPAFDPVGPSRRLRGGPSRSRVEAMELWISRRRSRRERRPLLPSGKTKRGGLVV